MFEGWLQIAIYIAALAAVAPLLGGYMARVYGGGGVALERLFGPAERLLYRGIRVDRDHEQDWKGYARSVLVFSAVSWFVMFVILRTQTLHPWNPNGFHSGTWDVSFNTAASFVTNTNWQYYGGETTMTYFSQMAGLGVQNFLSAAVGMVVAVAVIRGLAGRGRGVLGNFWVDLTRTLLYVLLPLAFIGALVLVSQGVPQTLAHYTHATTLSGFAQVLALGPAASQIAIKQLGTNGGGFFGVNSAMPFENPTVLANFVEMFFILMIPAAMTYTYGRMVGSVRQGWAIFAAMAAIFIVSTAVMYPAEQHGTPAQHAAGANTAIVAGSNGGNMEGKEQRFGVANSALWASATTAASNGSVNASMESMTGLGGAVAMVNLGTSEVVFGGVGSGLYGMLLFVVLAVFIGGLMVGRTPEFLGKKIGAKEIKLASLGALYMPFGVLVATALGVATDSGKKSLFAHGPQGFSETFYAYLSQGNNNGSAFAGYTGYVQPNPGNLGAHGVTFADLLGGELMLLMRFIPILLVLALAGSLAVKKAVPIGRGTLRTDSPTFVVLLVGVIILIGALTFFPAILLGPVAQSLSGSVF
ncbi:MAG: potassium-transporting ATPase subunit KdpA [Thermoleophilia bacterium]|nr:potassium-transporting ATPase subunit KdpA [Thermoleophilia bacterium]